MPSKSFVVVNVFGIQNVMDEDVGAYASRMGRRIAKVAEGIAPRRTGGLAAAHRFRGALKQGPFKIATRVENTSRHAEWVHEGTRAFITSPSGKHMGPIPRHETSLASPGRTGRKSFQLGGYHRRVRGQRAQPWLREAGETVAFTEANFHLA